MESIAALGIAAAAVQFVSFAADLVSNAVKIHAAADGCPPDTLSLATVYTRLSELSANLEQGTQHNGFPDQDIVALKQISHACNDDCKHLLAIVDQLKLPSNPGKSRRWGSFKLALKSLLKTREIAELEKRLHHSQTTLILLICKMAAQWHTSCEQQMTQLWRETSRLGIEHSKQLHNIERSLAQLSQTKSMAATTPIPQVMEIVDRMSNLSLSMNTAAIDQAILKSLRFDLRLERQTSISEPHSKTMKWVYEPPDYDEIPIAAGPSRLRDWLRGTGGLFWISGRVGSGKSTLMRYLMEEGQTKTLLSKWAHPKRCILASHFFWAAGTSMQKSQLGLLQTLVYDIFRQCPELIESACDRHSRQEPPQHLSHIPWSVKELTNILQHISKHQTLSVKFCFFIDGLDEYCGDHLEMCEALTELSMSPHIKLCVSSRPWNVFTKCFGADLSRKLYIHELTKGDVRRFAHSRLMEHRKWQSVANMRKEQEWFITEITERAHGVFLWVFLVTKMLRDGLTESDSIADLRKRLESFPDELEAVFRHMLKTVDPFYHDKMATSLIIASEAKQPLEAAIFDFHDREYEDENYVFQLGSFSQSELSDIRENVSRRLNARCRGLLEVDKQSGVVNYLHRTVTDFLRTREMAEFLSSKAPPNFDASLCLLKAHAALVKTSIRIPNDSKKGYVTGILNDIFSYGAATASLTATSKNTVVYDIFDDLESCFEIYDSEPPRPFEVDLHLTSDTRPRGARDYRFPKEEFSAKLLFQKQLFEAKCVPYIRKRIQSNRDYLAEFDVDPLLFAIGNTEPNYGKLPKFIWRRGFMDLLRCLLENGHNPNQVWRAPFFVEWGLKLQIPKPPWPHIITAIIPQTPQRRTEAEFTTEGCLLFALESGVIKEFLQHGANPNIAVYRLYALETITDRPPFSTPWIDFLLSIDLLPNNTRYQRAYLETLDAFIQNGAEFTLTANRELVNGNVVGLDSSSLRRLFSRMAQSSLAPDWDERQAGFFADVTEKLIIHSGRAGWPWSEYLGLVKGIRAFPPEAIEKLELMARKISSPDLENEDTDVTSDGNNWKRRLRPKDLGTSIRKKRC
ncbi:hypothetical protein B0T14DRAFT_526527 [Immersiella caudata]|uniref:NACHT domain-containing protein n=1 Tax=Immersiella caudata TaxID=314043 RepID=A0AA39WDV0_9PEZI|nr:hypothetical protein B0T14DRAFT_526527 [Immersiella caudata]